ncbi:MAG: hypothetical protein JXA20_09225 [Spirochaetes bacterium]|nr:hypothetical protein [Spirochaetota bacterium]
MRRAVHPRRAVERNRSSFLLEAEGRILLFLFVMFIIACIGDAGTAQAEPDAGISSRRIAVMDFATNNTPEYYSRIVRNIMEVTLFASGDFTLVEWEHIQEVLQGTGWEGDGDMNLQNSVVLGNRLDTDFMVVGSIDRIDQYRINARVIAVAEKRILIAYSRKFSSIGELDRASEKMAQDISGDIANYVRTGEVQRRFYDSYTIRCGFRGEFINPIGRYKNLVNDGFGAVFSAHVDHLPAENFHLGFTAGMRRHSGRRNSSDSLRVFPFMIDAGYSFSLYRRIMLVPEISAGIACIAMKHGYLPGFNMFPGSERTYTEPIVSANLTLALVPSRHVTMRFSAGYGFIYEPAGLMQYVASGIGVQFVF